MPPPAIADDFAAYVDWLADHLYDNEFPLPERLLQEEWTMTSLAFDLAYGDDDMKLIVYSLNKGLSYAEFVEEQRQEWLENDENDEPFDPTQLINEEIYQRVAYEEREKSQVCPDLPHSEEPADLAFRPLFASELKQMPSKAQRVAALRDFFALYNEESRK